MQPAESLFKRHGFPPKIIQAGFRLLISGILSNSSASEIGRNNQFKKKATFHGCACYQERYVRSPFTVQLEITEFKSLISRQQKIENIWQGTNKRVRIGIIV